MRCMIVLNYIAPASWKVVKHCITLIVDCIMLRGAKTVISYTHKSRVLNEQVKCMIIEKSKRRDV